MIECNESNYPIGILSPINLRPIKLHFLHYNSFLEAKEKWDERKKRIIYENIFVVSTFCYPVETATYSEQLLANWNKIKFKKVVLVDKKYGFDNEAVIKKPSECNDYAWLLYSPDTNNLERKVFNDYDFSIFLNNK